MREPETVPVERPSLPVDVIGHLVVVPRGAGPLIDVDSNSVNEDDLDAAIDSIFGATTDERPGRLDAALVIVGLAVSAWALLTSVQGPLLFLGILATLLGIALPARSLARSTRQRRQMGKRRKAIGDGFPLDASHPATRALVGAYSACLSVAAQPGISHANEAVNAAHLAMVEAASLLSGRRPGGTEETDYVRKRTRAIQAVTDQLEHTHRAWVESRMDIGIHATPGDRQWATAVIRAREELESTTGLGSLDALAGLASSLEREADDAAR